jgi:hypothetical protein
MFYPPRLFLKDRWISLPFLVAGILLIFMSWYTLYHIRPTEDLLFLHYNILYGVDLIGEWWKLWLIPLGAAVMGIVNLCISYFFYDKNRLISRILAVVTSGLEALLVIGCILVVGLNI